MLSEPSRRRVAVSGLVNLEVSIPAPRLTLIAGENLETPGIECHPSGVALNVATGLSVLGTDVRLTAITGTDLPGAVVRRHLDGLPNVVARYAELAQTPLTVLLSPPDGERALLRDAKGAATAVLDAHDVLTGCTAFVPTNIEANHALLPVAESLGIPVLVDVQAARCVEDPHNAPFLQAAEVAGMSDAAIPCGAEDWLRELGARFGIPTMVLGMGSRGAMLATSGGRHVTHVPAVSAGPVRSTVGAGDALWSCFVDGYLRGWPPLRCLRRAVVFAGGKVTVVGGSRGLVSAEDLDGTGETSLPD